jgi:hypothetical protein
MARLLKTIPGKELIEVTVAGFVVLGTTFVD